MSRVGKQPIAIPDGVTVSFGDGVCSVTGPKGELSEAIRAEVRVSIADGEVVVTRPNDQPQVRALHGLSRALIQNMVVGVTDGFRKSLELRGTGYRAQMQGSALVLERRLLTPGGDAADRRRVVRLRDTDAGSRGRHQQAGGRPAGRTGAAGAPARAVSRQGHPLRGRVRTAEGREGKGLTMAATKQTARAARQRRHTRVRRKIAGTAERPRLAVFRSNQHIYAQVIDDQAGNTLLAASDVEEAVRTRVGRRRKLLLGSASCWDSGPRRRASMRLCSTAAASASRAACVRSPRRRARKGWRSDGAARQSR